MLRHRCAAIVLPHGSIAASNAGDVRMAMSKSARYPTLVSSHRCVLCRSTRDSSKLRRASLSAVPLAAAVAVQVAGCAARYPRASWSNPSTSPASIACYVPPCDAPAKSHSCRLTFASFANFATNLWTRSLWRRRTAAVAAAVVAECEKVWVAALSRCSCLSRFLWYVPPFAVVVDGSAVQSCCSDTLVGFQVKVAAIPKAE